MRRWSANTPAREGSPPIESPQSGRSSVPPPQKVEPAHSAQFPPVWNIASKIVATRIVAPHRPTIGVFDSGVGGLTVLRALIDRIPGVDYLYFGDTARLPYGSKSAATVAHYAVDAVRYLQDHGAELLVIACNTATALALDEIKASCRRESHRRSRAGSGSRSRSLPQTSSGRDWHGSNRQQPRLPPRARGPQRQC